MTKDNQKTLDTLRALDTRVLRTEEELWSVAKLYNVKAKLHKVGIPLRRALRGQKAKTMYQEIRGIAVNRALVSGGASVEELCFYIEQAILSFTRTSRHYIW